MELRTLRDAPIVSGTRVMARVDVNEPVDAEGKPLGDFRLLRALPTLEYLAQKGARTVIVGHLGRDGASLSGIAQAMQARTRKAVIHFFAGTPAEAASVEIEPGACLMLENIRRDAREESGDPGLARELAALADIFVNDAFADSHRAHASIVGMAAYLPAFAGLLVEDEVAHLSQALVPPKGSVAVVGGAKFETKEPLITKLTSLYAHVCVGGALANDFLKARGVDVASSVVSSVPVPQALARNERVALPSDGRFKDGGASRVALLGGIAPDERILDAGPATLKAWGALVDAAPLVLWNGPLGVYEEGFTEGTETLAARIAAHCARGSARAILGGGDTLAALEKVPFDEQTIFRSTGGGAMLQFLADGTLPGLEALKK